jgi:hypothetical protein
MRKNEKQNVECVALAKLSFATKEQKKHHIWTRPTFAKASSLLPIWPNQPIVKIGPKICNPQADQCKP